MQPLLIVNADDYGMSTNVSRAILEAHQHGIVTSASVMAVGGAFEKTVGWLHDAPRLGLGAHLVASGHDRPVLRRRDIPTLVDRRGRFPRTWREFVLKLARGRIDYLDLYREFQAQLAVLHSHGLEIDHLDTHHNLHLWPDVTQVVLDVARDNGIGAVRIVRTHGRSFRGRVVQNLARGVGARIDRSGLLAPDAFAGFDEGGTFDASTMLDALRDLRRTDVAAVELCVHPTFTNAGHTSSRARRWDGSSDELDALTSAAVRHAVRELGFRLGTFRDLQPKLRNDQRVIDVRDRVLARARERDRARDRVDGASGFRDASPAAQSGSQNARGGGRRLYA